MVDVLSQRARTEVDEFHTEKARETRIAIE